MSSLKTSPFDISICITTYNRSAYLARCLTHLLTFTSLRFEVIIGDDASTDETEEIIKQFIHQFPFITYCKHEKNLGVSRNTDAIVRMARGQYVYILSDDDLVYENALIIMKNILDTRPSAACITGPYDSKEETEIGLNKGYAGTKVRVFQKRDYLDMTEHFLLVSDGYPLMRRDIFDRYCTFHDRSFCLTTLIFNMLMHGEVLYLEEPVFQHCRSAGSLSSNLSEPWFIDNYISDIEIALSNITQHLPANKLDELRNRALRNLYFQGARRSMVAKDYSLFWYFIRRTNAVGGMKMNCLLQCEIHYLLHIAIDRLRITIEQSGGGVVYYQDTSFVRNFVMLSKATTTGVHWYSLSELPDNSEKQVCLLESYDAELINALNLNNVVSLLDLIASLQLSPYKLNIIVANDQLKLSYLEDEAMKLAKEESSRFQLLHMKYEA